MPSNPDNVVHWIPLLLIGALGGYAVLCFWRSYEHLRPGSPTAQRRRIMRGPLSRTDMYTTEGWALRLRGWIFAGLSLLVLAAWGIWSIRSG